MLAPDAPLAEEAAADGLDSAWEPMRRAALKTAASKGFLDAIDVRTLDPIVVFPTEPVSLASRVLL